MDTPSRSYSLESPLPQPTIAQRVGRLWRRRKSRRVEPKPAPIPRELEAAPVAATQARRERALVYDRTKLLRMLEEDFDVESDEITAEDLSDLDA